MQKVNNFMVDASRSLEYDYVQLLVSAGKVNYIHRFPEAIIMNF